MTTPARVSSDTIVVALCALTFTALAMPKSRILMVPSGVTLMLAGLRSR